MTLISFLMARLERWKNATFSSIAPVSPVPVGSGFTGSGPVVAGSVFEGATGLSGSGAGVGVAAGVGTGVGGTVADGADAAVVAVGTVVVGGTVEGDAALGVEAGVVGVGVAGVGTGAAVVEDVLDDIAGRYPITELSKVFIAFKAPGILFA